jgi:NAD(P) transhydrogenase subunit beta
MHAAWLTYAYLITAMMFVLGIKRLGSPATARQGNQIAAAGMVIAVVTTVIDLGGNGLALALPAVILGAVLGGVAARRVPMTGMPQMVALFNGLGAGAAALIAIDDFRHVTDAVPGASLPPIDAIPIVLSCLIGSISFSGSLVAFAKLQELISTRPMTYPHQKIGNGSLLALIIALGVWIIVAGNGLALLAAFVVLALVLGVLFVLPIGGADMPVIISLLNSFTGLAAAITGFVLMNEVLIVSGALVGASGTILTQLMSRAMNRSLQNVLFGAFGSGGGAAPSVGGGEAKPVRTATVEDVAVLLAYARRVVIIPGYGLAVARGQHAVKELADELEERGVEVEYAIHPVAGRMPGHMNVLLAEAKVPYTQLKEMDEINPNFVRTDVALVIGANDVVNPAARNEAGSPIYGMPILNADQAQSVVVLKRSMSTGFAGIDNPLFYDPKTVMLFGDAQKTVTALASEVKRVLAAA